MNLSPHAAAMATAIGVGAVLAPTVNLWRTAARDSFPLSHYPMFSVRRGTHIDVTFLRGTRADGSHRRLDSRLAASGGMNQERKQIHRAARRGRGDRLARKVARRIHRRDIHPDIVAVEVVAGSFLLRDYFELGAGGIEPVTVDVLGRHDLHTLRDRRPEAT